MNQIRNWLYQQLNDHEPGEAPARQLWSEALGFFILFFALFVTIALFGYDAGDLGKMKSGSQDLNNLVGPFGAQIASGLLSNFGFVSYAWPPALFIWGFLLATGVIRRPKKRRFILFFLLSICVAALAAILYPDSQLPAGQGGNIGQTLGLGAKKFAGKVGAVLLFTFAAIVSLIFTRNMSFSIQKKVSKSSRKRDPDLDFIDHSVSVDVQHSDDQALNETHSPSYKETPSTQSPETSRDPSGVRIQLDLETKKSAPSTPDLKIFKKASITSKSGDDDQEMAEILTEKLNEFKVSGEIVGVTGGPVVKTYEFEPSAGTKVAKIEALESDLARLLKTDSLRIVPVQGATTIGFEVPEPDRKIIPFGNLVHSPEFQSGSASLPIAMGVDCFGTPVIEDLATMPHLLVAGSTGSGKSVFINTLITSLIAKNSAKDLRLILIDPKMVELGMFNDVAHLACPVVTQVEQEGLPLLRHLVDQMELRYTYLNQLGAKNITAFNETIKTGVRSKFKNYKGKWQTMPYVVVVVDEFADLIMTLGKEAEQAIARLAQKARAAGIHLVIATQRPSVQVVTGTIKANFPTRVGFRVTSGVDSRTILDKSGAETLLGNGDMLYLSPTGLQRLHSGFLAEAELKKVVKACQQKGKR